MSQERMSAEDQSLSAQYLDPLHAAADTISQALYPCKGMGSAALLEQQADLNPRHLPPTSDQRRLQQMS
jgi:hypothetical protein